MKVFGQKTLYRRLQATCAVAAAFVCVYQAEAGASDEAFSKTVTDMAKERERVLSKPWASPANDSANSNTTSKSWTIHEIGPQERQFLQTLKWQEHKIGNYVLRTGLIFDKWIAAMQFSKNGKVLLTEITPPYEYVKMVDPLTSLVKDRPLAEDADKDGNLEIAFLHEKLNDARYHMYTVYRLNKDCPQLIWKSGGDLGDWIGGNSTVKNRATIKIHSQNSSTK